MLSRLRVDCTFGDCRVADFVRHHRVTNYTLTSVAGFMFGLFLNTAVGTGTLESIAVWNRPLREFYDHA